MRTIIWTQLSAWQLQNISTYEILFCRYLLITTFTQCSPRPSAVLCCVAPLLIMRGGHALPTCHVTATLPRDQTRRTGGRAEPVLDVQSAAVEWGEVLRLGTSASRRLSCAVVLPGRHWPSYYNFTYLGAEAATVQPPQQPEQPQPGITASAPSAWRM